MGKALWTEAFPEQVRSKPKEKKWPSAISKKRRDQLKVYSRKKRAFLKRHKVCQAEIPGVCKKVVDDIHHSRGRIGELLNLEEFWIPVCRRCHDWINGNPDFARERGLICERGRWNTQ